MNAFVSKNLSDCLMLEHDRLDLLGKGMQCLCGTRTVRNDQKRFAATENDLLRQMIDVTNCKSVNRVRNEPIKRKTNALLHTLSQHESSLHVRCLIPTRAGGVGLVKTHPGSRASVSEWPAGVTSFHQMCPALTGLRVHVSVWHREALETNTFPNAAVHACMCLMPSGQEALAADRVARLASTET